MKQDREMALQAMRKMGWFAERKKRGKTPIWEFRRPDTGGLWDVVTCRQDTLSMSWVAEISMQYNDADDLLRKVNGVKERWLRDRFPSLYANAQYN